MAVPRKGYQKDRLHAMRVPFTVFTDTFLIATVLVHGQRIMDQISSMFANHSLYLKALDYPKAHGGT